MKLKEFNSENCQTARSRVRTPCISLNKKSGTFRISKSACEFLHLKSGDQVAFHQDEDNSEDWYIEVVKSKGFALRLGSGGNKDSLIFNNTTLIRQIYESVAFTGLSGKVLIAGKPTEFNKRKLYGLLTGTLRNE